MATVAQQPGSVIDTDADRSARVELAAAHRAADLLGWSALTFNHIARRVPSRPDHFWVKPDRLLYSEVTASSLVELRIADGGPVREDSEMVNSAAAIIHAAILDARPEVNSSIHVHTDGGVMIGCIPEGLQPHSQGSMMFYNRLSYHNFEGVVDAADERRRLQADLGRNFAMVLRNHGLLVCGTTVANTILMMKELVDAARTQMMLYASNRPFLTPPPEVCERTARQFDKVYESNFLMGCWQALVRMVDAADPSYRD